MRKLPSACARLGHWGCSWAVLGRPEQSSVPPKPCSAGTELGHWGKGRSCKLIQCDPGVPAP